MSRTLRPCPTAVAAFVGLTAAGHDEPAGAVVPRLVTSWTEFEQLYGGFAAGCMLPFSVFGYFQNGGSRAYVAPVRAAPDLASGLDFDEVLAPTADVTMVVVPDLVTAARKEDGSFDLARWKDVQTALVSHCSRHRRMAILDPPPGMTPEQVSAWVSGAGYDSAFAAIYYPWIEVENKPATSGDSLLAVPPSGHVAGAWARSDESRGVWKAPGNLTVNGCLDVEHRFTLKEVAPLFDPVGINCICPLGKRGIRIWGAHTLSSDPRSRYVNGRRFLNMVETTVVEGTRWTALEPDDARLWESVTGTVAAFLDELWKAGALYGRSAAEAFYVRCGEETNPSESAGEGRVAVAVEVGVVPWRGYSVRFRVIQEAQRASLSEWTLPAGAIDLQGGEDGGLLAPHDGQLNAPESPPRRRWPWSRPR